MAATVAHEYVTGTLTTATPAVTVSNPVAADDVLVLVEMGAFVASSGHCTSFAGLGGTWVKRSALTCTPFDVWVGTGCTGTGDVTGAGGTLLGSVNRKRLVVWHLEDVSDTILETLVSGTGTITSTALDAELGQLVLGVGYTSNPPANAISAYTPTTDWSQPANLGTGAYNLTGDNVRYGKPLYRTPAGPDESHAISVIRGAGATCYGAVLVVGDPLPAPPGVPTSVVGTPAHFTASLTWEAPVTGGPPTSYDVRIDGGAPVAATSPHVFLGLVESTAYTLEVRAVNLAGASAWVPVEVTTLDPLPENYYRVDVEVGPYTYSAVRGDAATYGIMLPLSLGWDMPEAEEFYPLSPNMPTMTFRLLVGDAGDLVDLVEGSRVLFNMYLDDDPEAEPWQTFDGTVTQLVGEPVQGSGDSLDFQVTVYAADRLMELSELVIGWTVDWPLETQGDRLDRIAAEAGLGGVVVAAGGLEGQLAARSKRPITVLQAVQDTLKDTAWEDSSSLGGPYYGCYQVTYERPYVDEFDVPVPGEIVLDPLARRIYDDQSNVITLDGCNVFAAAKWNKLRGHRARTWGLVDTTTFGAPDTTTPFWRSTSLVDHFDEFGVNSSAAMRDRIGESLLATASELDAGWHARVLRVDTQAEPLPLAGGVFTEVGIPSRCPTVSVQVIVTPLEAELELEGVDYLTGILVGARLTIPPGGGHYVDLSLRAELLDGVTLP